MTYATVRAITSPELTKLRSGTQWSKLYLAVHKPNTVYTARLTSVLTSNDRVMTITFNTGSGVLGDCRRDMNLYIGTTAGARDIGVARLRKLPDAGIFYIGETSEIDFVNNPACYLTVTDEYGLWPKHIVTVDDDTFYMDGDIVYTDQNEEFHPVPIMGSHRVLKLTGATVSTTYDWSNSYCLESSISGYSVECPGSSGITGSTTTAPTVTFDAPGWYPVYLTVTAANGKTAYGVRYVYVWNDANPPVTTFQLGSCFGEYETGGWNFSLTLQDEIDITEVPERTLCILFAEDYYNNVQESMGQLIGSENIICVGHISEELLGINPEQGDVSITVQGAQYWLQQIYAFPCGVIGTQSAPTNWAEMEDPIVDKILFHLAYWRSTMVRVMDVYLTGDTRYATELSSPASNLWGQLQELAFATIYARPGVDRYGRIFFETEPQITPLGQRTWPDVMEITKEDWYDSIRMQRVIIGSNGMINSSGVVINAAGEGNALFSLAPGHVFRRYGTAEIIDRLLLSTQALSNRFAGLIQGWRNNEYPNTEMRLSANNRFIDLFPRQRYPWEVLATDNPRGIAFDKKFIPRRVEFLWDFETGYLETAISLERETEKQLHTTGDTPGGDDDGNPPPPPPFPEPPPPIVIVPPPVPVEGFTKALLYCRKFGFLYSENFNEASPYWEQRNAGLGDVVITSGAGAGTLHYQNFNRYFVTPSGAVWAAKLGAIDSGDWSTGIDYFSVVRAASIGATFEIIIDMNDSIINGPPPFANFYGISNIGRDKVSPERVLINVRHGSGSAVNHLYYYTGGSLTQKAVNTLIASGGDAANGGISFGFNQWLITVNNKYGYANYDASSIASTVTDSNISFEVFNPESSGHIRVLNSAYVYCKGDGTPGYLLFSADSLTTYLGTADSGITFIGLDTDPTGQYLMTQYGVGKKGKSSDYGTSWTTMGSLPVGDWQFRNLGDSDHWMAAAGTAIRSTDDFGTTWINKEGNLNADFPLSEIVRPVWAGA